MGHHRQCPATSREQELQSQAFLPSGTGWPGPALAAQCLLKA